LLPGSAGLAESPAGDSTAIHVGDGSRIGSIRVEGDVAGRDIYKITEELAYDVSDLTYNPYLGLAPYSYETRAFYGGRDQQIGETVERLTRAGAEPVLVFVTGASGSGKSSFVQAGLVPALEDSYHKHRTGVRWSIMRPGRYPLAALYRALVDIGICDSTTGDAPGVVNSPEDLNRRLTSHTSPKQVNVIVLDQFEELFTQADPGERDAVCALLAGLGTFSQIRTHLIATMRADYLPALFDIPALFVRAKESGIELRPMQEEELSRAIRRPVQEEARREGKDKRIDPALVDRLVEAVQGDAALLPLLQVTLRSLWDQPPHKLVVSRYESLTDALKQQADRVYAEDRQGHERAPGERAAIMDLFVQLVEVSLDADTRRDVGRSVPRSELLKIHAERAGLIDELVEARLLSTSTEQHGQLSVEVVRLIHETLLTRWPQLASEIAARRSALQEGVRFEISLKDWVEHQKSADYLLDGVHLAEAQELANARDPVLARAGAEEFLAASLQHAEAEHQQELERLRELNEANSQRAEAEHRGRIRQARFTKALAGLAMVVALVTVVAVRQTIDALSARATAESETATSKSQAQALEAIGQLQTNPEQSLSLATRAALTKPTFEAEDALRQALLYSHVRSVMTEPDGVTTDAVLSPDGSFAVTGSQHGAVRVWSASNGFAAPVDYSRHSSAVAALAVSHDSRRIASGSFDNTVQVWNLGQPTQPLILRGHTDAVVGVSFSPDDQRVLTASQDGSARVWNAADGTEQFALRHAASVNSAVFDRSGRRIATSSADYSVRIWDALTGQQLATMDLGEPVDAVAFTADGLHLAVASYDPTAHIFDLTDPLHPAEVRLAGHTGAVVSVAFSPDDKTVVTASNDKDARLWDAQTGQSLKVLSGHTGPLFSATFAPEPYGARVLTSSADHTARIWDAGTGKQLAVFRGHTGDVTAAMFGADGQQVLTVGDNTARVWAPTADQEWIAISGFADAVSAVEFSRDGRSVVAASADGSAQVWDTASWSRRATLIGHTQAIVRATFSRTGESVATASLDGTARIWDATTGQVVHVLKGHTAALTDVRFSPDDSRVMTGARDGTARLWDAHTGAQLRLLAVPGATITGVAFDPHGAWVLGITSDGTAPVWDVGTGRQVGMLVGQHGWLTGATVDQASGRVVTSSSDGPARVWAPPQSAQPIVLTGAQVMTTSAAFSPDGSRIVTSSVDGLVRVWTLSSANPPLELNGHRLPVWTAAFSPNGDAILSAGDDGTARLWDASLGTPRSVLHGNTGPIRVASFSPDGRYVATGGRDGVVQIHLTGLRDLVELAYRRLSQAACATIDECRATRGQ
jgi:WD40 repeat protein